MIRIKRGLTPRQPAAVQGGTPKGNVAVRQRQRQPPLENNWGFFLSANISSIESHPRSNRASASRGRK